MPDPFTFSPRKATFDEKKIFIISTAVRRIHLSIHKTTWWCKNKQNYKKTAGPRFRHTFTISENWVERNWKTERWGLQPYQTHLQRSKPCRRQNRSWQLFFLSAWRCLNHYNANEKYNLSGNNCIHNRWQTCTLRSEWRSNCLANIRFPFCCCCNPADFCSFHICSSWSQKLS